MESHPLTDVVELQSLRLHLAEQEARVATRELGKHEHVFLFQGGERTFAVPLSLVTEVLPMAALTRLPGQGGSLVGWLERQGNWLPVVDPAVSPVEAAPVERITEFLVVCSHPTGSLALRATALGATVSIVGLSLIPLPSGGGTGAHVIAAVPTAPSALLLGVGVIAALVAPLTPPLVMVS